MDNHFITELKQETCYRYGKIKVAVDITYRKGEDQMYCSHCYEASRRKCNGHWFNLDHEEHCMWNREPKPESNS